MMTRKLLIHGWCGVALALGACSQAAPNPSGSTGSGGSSSGSGGSSTEGSGGATGSGGSSTSSTGGSVGSGGSTGSGGSNSSSGGSTGSGGSGSPSGGSTGSGGSGSGGATTATGGRTTGSGGSTVGTGGAMTGSGGAMATGGAGGAVTAASIVPDLVGFYWEGTCVGTTDPGGRNCPMFDNGATCMMTSDYYASGTNRDKVFNVKGVTGQKYTVTIEVRGVVGGRCYKGGMRASTASASDTGYNNWWYVGGVQDNNSWWNTYELHVSPSTGDASKDVYYFNAADNPAGSYCEKEATYLVKYTASFKVVGGGTMTFRLHDSNCKAQQNCGAVASTSAACDPRTVDLTGVSPQPPTTFKQPPTTQLSKTYYPQWMWITAKSVTSP